IIAKLSGALAPGGIGYLIGWEALAAQTPIGIHDRQIEGFELRIGREKVVGCRHEENSLFGQE
ncbi:MAG: hypothetical protein RIA65_15735, partial [Woeseia sp.]